MGDRKTEPIGTVFLITYPELRLIGIERYIQLLPNSR